MKEYYLYNYTFLLRKLADVLKEVKEASYHDLGENYETYIKNAELNVRLAIKSLTSNSL